jgi:hypothetical protein
MIPYEVDPSLHTTEPEEPSLDDGFSRPHAAQERKRAEVPAKESDELEPSLAEKSLF